MAIGGCTVAELRDRMEHREYIEWVARSRIEPFGDRRSELHNATLMSLLTHIWSKKGKRIEDLIVDFWADTEPTSLEDKFFALQQALGQSSGNDSRDPSDQARS